jgi:predicted transport protein
MLGENWKAIQKTWLHRLGNLTLTGYNSKYSDRNFEQKKTIDGGFSDSSVRLNKFVREQSSWTEKEIAVRTNTLAQRAIACWTGLSVQQSLVDAADHLEKRELAKRQDVSKVAMSSEARVLFEALQARIIEIDHDVLELAESKSVSYHNPQFFLEVLPRRYRISVLLALDFDEIDDPFGLAQDASQWKFLVNARHEGGVLLKLSSISEIDSAIPLIRQAHAASGE